MRHNTTERLRYFHASNNNSRIFPEPFLIQSRDDFQNFVATITDRDLTENSFQDIEDSQWVFHDLTNLSVYVNHLDFPIRANVETYTTKAKTRGVLDVSTDKNACFFIAWPLKKTNK